MFDYEGPASRVTTTFSMAVASQEEATFNGISTAFRWGRLLAIHLLLRIHRASREDIHYQFYHHAVHQQCDPSQRRELSLCRHYSQVR
jgi:hypothetical protein